jgi:pimeloyl-ACP methyl ester carboxylesterase
MTFLSELRYPTTRRARLFTGFLALVLFFLVATAMISGVLLYQILHPARTSSEVDLSFLLGRPTEMSFPVPQGGQRDGWFFPGRRGAPTIVVCHGYQSQRAEVLTLVTSLQEHQFNVFAFNFSGHGRSLGTTTLGYQETRELRAALEVLSKRDDVDSTRFGAWGSDMGAYAVLSAATSDPRIAALAVESVYDEPRRFVGIQVTRSGLGVLPLVLGTTEFAFLLGNRSHRREPPLSARLGRLKGVPKLFIVARDNPELANSTRLLFELAPPPRQQSVQKTGYTTMSDEERRAYEFLVVSFFLQNLPPGQRPKR